MAGVGMTLGAILRQGAVPLVKCDKYIFQLRPISSNMRLRNTDFGRSDLFFGLQIDCIYFIYVCLLRDIQIIQTKDICVAIVVSRVLHI
jgi:hypothetical protein